MKAEYNELTFKIAETSLDDGEHEGSDADCE